MRKVGFRCRWIGAYDWIPRDSRSLEMSVQMGEAFRPVFPGQPEKTSRGIRNHQRDEGRLPVWREGDGLELSQRKLLPKARNSVSQMGEKAEHIPTH